MDLEALATAARRADGGEAFLELSKDGGHRIGVVASVFPSNCVYYTLECSFHLFPTDGGVESALLGRASEIVRALEEDGYDLIHQDDGWISCEKIVPPEEVSEAAEALLRRIPEPRIGIDGAPAAFFTMPFFQEVASRLNADLEWRALSKGFSARVVLTCLDRSASYVLEVDDGRVVAQGATGETAADFRFEADSAAWVEIMRGEADYHPLVRAGRMRFRGSVFRLRLKMAPLDHMTLVAQQVYRRIPWSR